MFKVWQDDSQLVLLFRYLVLVLVLVVDIQIVPSLVAGNQIALVLVVYIQMALWFHSLLLLRTYMFTGKNAQGL